MDEKQIGVGNSDTTARPATEAAVFRAVDRLNELLAETQRVPKDRDALLFADGSVLDSLALINLLVFVEDEVRDAFGRELVLAGEEEQNGPLNRESLNTLGSLIDGLHALLASAT
jgi:acyl carrier protein